MSPAITTIPAGSDNRARATCSSCMVVVSDLALKCSGCQCCVHLRCSELPDYQLVRLAQSQAQYVCSNCVKTKTLQSTEEYDNEVTKIKEAIAKEISIIDQLNSELEDGQGDAPVETVNDAPATDRTQPPEANATPTVATVKPLCKFYMRRGCKHGRKGESCQFEHPKLCFKFIKNGDRRGGCKLGKNCSYAHPKLCDSYRSGVCKREKCGFYHIKGTKFQTKQHDVIENNNNAQNPRGVVQRPEESSGQPIQPQRVLQRPQTQSSDGMRGEEAFRPQSFPSQVDPRDFLEMKSQLKAITEQLQLLLMSRTAPLERVLPRASVWGQQ